MFPARQVSEGARKRFCACMMYIKTRSSDVREDIKEEAHNGAGVQ